MADKTKNLVSRIPCSTDSNFVTRGVASIRNPRAPRRVKRNQIVTSTWFSIWMDSRGKEMPLNI
jgi:hypothetical protein